MVLLKNFVSVTYKNRDYIVFSMKKYIEIPVVIDKEIYNFIKNEPRHFYINDNLMIYTKIKIEDKLIDIYLHEIVMKLNKSVQSVKSSYKAILHINKINIDNRLSNLTFDTINKEQTKNLHKKERIIDLSEYGICVDSIPSFVWYLNEDDTHGDRFIVEMGPLKWKTTSSTKLSLRYKLEEMKKFLRLNKGMNPELFKDYSMNGDLNDAGLNLKKEYYEIIKLAGYPYKFQNVYNTDDLLKEDLSGLSKIEIKLLREFNLDTKETTNDRIKLKLI